MGTVKFNIYFNDLNDEAQKELLSILGIDDPREMNWDMDILPLATFEVDLDV